MDVWTSYDAGVDEGIETLDYELGAGEAHHGCLSRGCRRMGEPEEGDG